MPNKLLVKLTTGTTYLVVSIVLILSLVASLMTFAHTQPAHATTLPAYRYTKTFDTSASGAYAQGNGVATDSSGNVYVAGYFQGTVVFDGVGGSDSQTTANYRSSFLTKYNANGTYAYTKTFDTSASGYANISGVATDSSGNVYVTGYFNGTVVFDGVGGSDSQLTANASSFLTKYNPNGTYAYTKTLDTSASGTYAHGYGVATDSSGNVYVTGQFDGTVVFDGVGGGDSQTEANYSSFLTKYNPSGTYAYTKTFDTSASGASAQGASVATDSSGNVYVTGHFGGTVVFDGVGGSDTQTETNTSAFLTSYQVSIPSQPSPALTPASAPVPGAPNTGFGVFMTNPLRTLTSYSLVAMTIASLAVVSRKFTRRLSK